MPRVAALCLLSHLCLSGCGPQLTPVPREEPFEGVVSDLAFGMYAADFRNARPDFHLSDTGTYGELVGLREYSYLFMPKADSAPPPLTARLAGVESREEFFDTLRMWPAWRRLTTSYARATGVPPRCAVFGSRRLSLTRAAFDAPINHRVTAEIIRHPDGRSYEAFLVARLGMGEIEEEPAEAGQWTSVDCVHFAR